MFKIKNFNIILYRLKTSQFARLNSIKVNKSSPQNKTYEDFNNINEINKFIDIKENVDFTK